MTSRILLRARAVAAGSDGLALADKSGHLRCRYTRMDPVNYRLRRMERSNKYAQHPNRAKVEDHMLNPITPNQHNCFDDPAMSRLIRVQYAFNGNPQQQQLSFPAGAEVLVNPQSEKNGWIHGTYQNNAGWLPSAFVPPVPPQQQHSQQALNHQQPQQQHHPQPQHVYQPQNMSVNQQHHPYQSPQAQSSGQQQQQQQQRKIGMQHNFDPLASRSSSINPIQQVPQQGQPANGISQPPANPPNIERRNDEGVGSCPLCFKKFPLAELERHAAECNGNEEKKCPMCQKRCLSLAELETHAAYCEGANNQGSSQQQSKTMPAPQERRQQQQQQQQQHQRVQTPGMNPQQQQPQHVSTMMQPQQSPIRQQQSPIQMQPLQQSPQHQQRFQGFQQQPGLSQQQPQPQQQHHHPQPQVFQPHTAHVPQQQTSMSPGPHRQVPQMPIPSHHAHHHQQQQPRPPYPPNYQHAQPMSTARPQQHGQMPGPPMQQQQQRQNPIPQNQPQSQNQLPKPVDTHQPISPQHMAQSQAKELPQAAQNDQTSERAKSNSPPVDSSKHPNSKYAEGQIVWYKYRGTKSKAKILKVHFDDDLEPFYDIQWNDREKQTDDAHLEELLDENKKEDGEADNVPPAMVPGNKVMGGMQPKAGFEAFDQLVNHMVPQGTPPFNVHSTAATQTLAPAQTQSLVPPSRSSPIVANQKSHAQTLPEPQMQQPQTVPQSHCPQGAKSSFSSFDQMRPQNVPHQGGTMSFLSHQPANMRQNSAVHMQMANMSLSHPNQSGRFDSLPTPLQNQSALTTTSQQSSTVPNNHSQQTPKSSSDASAKIVNQTSTRSSDVATPSSMPAGTVGLNSAAPVPNSNGFVASNPNSAQVQKAQTGAYSTDQRNQSSGVPNNNADHRSKSSFVAFDHQSVDQTTSASPLPDSTIGRNLASPEPKPDGVDGQQPNPKQIQTAQAPAPSTTDARRSSTVPNGHGEQVSKSTFDAFDQIVDQTNSTPSDVSSLSHRAGSTGQVSASPVQLSEQALNETGFKDVSELNCKQSPEKPTNNAVIETPALNAVSQPAVMVQSQLKSPSDPFDAFDSIEGSSSGGTSQEATPTFSLSQHGPASATAVTTTPGQEVTNRGDSWNTTPPVNPIQQSHFSGTSTAQAIATPLSEPAPVSQDTHATEAPIYELGGLGTKAVLEPAGRLNQRVSVEQSQEVNGDTPVVQGNPFDPVGSTPSLPNRASQPAMFNTKTVTSHQGPSNTTQSFAGNSENPLFGRQSQQPIATQQFGSPQHNLNIDGDDDYDDCGFQVMGGTATPSPWSRSGGAVLPIPDTAMANNEGATRKKRTENGPPSNVGGPVSSSEQKPAALKRQDNTVENGYYDSSQRSPEMGQYEMTASPTSWFGQSGGTNGWEEQSGKSNDFEVEEASEKIDSDFVVMGGSRTDSGWKATGDNGVNIAEHRLKKQGSVKKKKKKARAVDEDGRRRETKVKKRHASTRRRASTEETATTDRSSQFEATSVGAANDEVGRQRSAAKLTESKEDRRSERRLSSSKQRLEGGARRKNGSPTSRIYEGMDAAGTSPRDRNQRKRAGGRPLQATPVVATRVPSTKMMTGRPVQATPVVATKGPSPRMMTGRPVQATPVIATRVPSTRMMREAAPSSKDRKSMLAGSPLRRSKAGVAALPDDQKKKKKGKRLGFL
eukprot:scaffold333_cov133-Cylindrotheca_fusiformis.AAC.19